MVHGACPVCNLSFRCGEEAGSCETRSEPQCGIRGNAPRTNTMPTDRLLGSSLDTTVPQSQKRIVLWDPQPLSQKHIVCWDPHDYLYGRNTSIVGTLTTTLPIYRRSTTSSFPLKFCTPSTRAHRTDDLTQAARDRATALVEAYVPTPATEGDLRCIEERQLRHKAGASSRSVGVSPNPCRHGFPQAFAFDPCGHKVRFGAEPASSTIMGLCLDDLST